MEEQEESEELSQEDGSWIKNYLKDGINLKRGDRVYRTSYQAESDMTEMAYDYDNLYCDLVRVIKENEILQDGKLENIDELYKIGIENEADVMLRTGILQEDGDITYIAWCNLNDLIEKSRETTKEQSDEDKEASQREYEETEK